MVGVVVKNKKIRRLTTAQGPAAEITSFGVGVRHERSTLVLLWALVYCGQCQSWVSEVLSFPPSHPIRSHITQAPDEVYRGERCPFRQGVPVT
jgi:hypothetical protein